MSTPVITVTETNTSSATLTDLGTTPTICFASIDAPSNTAGLVANNPLSLASNSFEKWLRAHVSTPATNTLSDFQVIWSPVPATDSNGNAANAVVLYGVNQAFPGGGPTNALSPYATAPVVNVTADIDAPANTTGAYSGYWTQQLQISLGCPYGNIIFPNDYTALDFIWS